uniref:glutamate--cysteine ligase n=1 Tax=Lactuca sativa TaxID=4236 RepID=A0A9R1UNH3_LACSA|nr:hypothetical protein LSAT_V11C800426310 [Lactuca sativa]
MTCDSSSKSSQKMHHEDAIAVKSKRGNQVVVVASPPTEDAVVAIDPLTKEDLVWYLASGCKPKENWRIGVEHEKFGFELKTLKPMTISLEPGDQFELSGAPLETLHQTCAEVKAVAEEMGIGFIGIGFQPKLKRNDIPIVPKRVYSCSSFHATFLSHQKDLIVNSPEAACVAYTI